jgi:hypothetical protein
MGGVAALGPAGRSVGPLSGRVQPSAGLGGKWRTAQSVIRIVPGRPVTGSRRRRTRPSVRVPRRGGPCPRSGSWRQWPESSLRRWRRSEGMVGAAGQLPGEGHVGGERLIESVVVQSVRRRVGRQLRDRDHGPGGRLGRGGREACGAEYVDDGERAGPELGELGAISVGTGDRRARSHGLRRPADPGVGPPRPEGRRSGRAGVRACRHGRGMQPLGAYAAPVGRIHRATVAAVPHGCRRGPEGPFGRAWGGNERPAPAGRSAGAGAPEGSSYGQRTPESAMVTLARVLPLCEP